MDDPADFVQQSFTEKPRADEQLAEDRGLHAARDGVEHFGDIVADLLVRREEAEILVRRRIRGVVVPRSDVDVPAQAAVLPPHEQRELRMHLQIGSPVGDVDTGSLEGA